MPNMTLTERDGWGVVALEGELTLPSAAELRGQMLSALAGGLPLRLELSGAEDLDLPALQVLLALRSDCLRAGRGFAVSDSESEIWRRTLERAGITLVEEESR